MERLVQFFMCSNNGLIIFPINPFLPFNTSHKIIKISHDAYPCESFTSLTGRQMPILGTYCSIVYGYTVLLWRTPEELRMHCFPPGSKFRLTHQQIPQHPTKIGSTKR